MRGCATFPDHEHTFQPPLDPWYEVCYCSAVREFFDNPEWGKEKTAGEVFDDADEGRQTMMRTRPLNPPA